MDKCNELYPGIGKRTSVKNWHNLKVVSSLVNTIGTVLMLIS